VQKQNKITSTKKKLTLNRFIKDFIITELPGK